MTYRKHPQQRRFPCILKTNHRDVHFRRPISAKCNEPSLADRNVCLRGRAARLFSGNQRMAEVHLPEHSEKPVINRAKDARHDVWILGYPQGKRRGKQKPRRQAASRERNGKEGSRGEEGYWWVNPNSSQKSLGWRTKWGGIGGGGGGLLLRDLITTTNTLVGKT